MLWLVPDSARSRTGDEFERLLYHEVTTMLADLGVEDLVKVHFVPERTRILLGSRTRHMSELSRFLDGGARKPKLGDQPPAQLGT